MADQATTAAPSGVNTYLAGFVYRGRAPWEAAPAEYHVEIGQYVEVAGMAPMQLPTQVLTPEAAQAAGHALPDVLAAINAEALAELIALRATAAELTNQNGKLGAALSQAQDALAKVDAFEKKMAETMAALKAAAMEDNATIQELRNALAALRAVAPQAEPPAAAI
ncbi:hypothetical protein SR39_06100 [Methylobacterium radiotolerans]|jgi:ABC-type transporter Mla subunit MlaD|nr:hypothetical protein SR39_06100 [Methylobacterium radiotolerans]